MERDEGFIGVSDLASPWSGWLVVKGSGAPYTLPLFCNSGHCQGLCQLESRGGHLSQPVLVGMGRERVLVVDWQRGVSRWVNDLLSVQEQLFLALVQRL